MRALILAFPLAWNAVAAGPLIIGARGGVPFANTNDAVINSVERYGNSQTYKIGPTAGVKLPLGFSVEGDALFSRQTLDVAPISGFGAFGANLDSWEFPVMVKYTAGRSIFAPVLGAGLSFRHINDFAGGIPSQVLTLGASSNSVGFVAGGGVRFNFGPVAVTPEVRYTRWNESGGWRSSLLNLLPYSRNEASVLVGVTF